MIETNHIPSLVLREIVKKSVTTTKDLIELGDEAIEVLVMNEAAKLGFVLSESETKAVAKAHFVHKSFLEKSDETH